MNRAKALASGNTVLYELSYLFSLKKVGTLVPIDRVGSKSLIKEINELRVISTIRAAGGASRTEVAKATGLSPAAVTGIVGRLMTRGLVVESHAGRSTGGRPQTRLSIRPDWGVVVGAKVTETEVVAVLADLDATVLAQATVPVSGQDAGSVEDAVASVVEQFATPDRPPVCGVGVGLAGVVDRWSGIVRNATYFHWKDEPIGQRLSDRLGVPVAIDNDVNTMALAEQAWGAAQHVSDFVLVSVGRGIGMAMVARGELHRGADGGAGELGHIKVVPDGRQCACGLHGCLETVAGEPALRDELAQVMGRDLTVDAAAELARTGQAAAASVFATAGSRLGAAVATVVQLVNPRLVVVAGEGARYADLLMPAFEEALGEGVGDAVRPQVVVDSQGWDATAWARGAASLALREMFHPDVLSSTEPSKLLVG